MVDIVLVEPEIPQNTGNIARCWLDYGCFVLLVNCFKLNFTRS